MPNFSSFYGSLKPIITLAQEESHRLGHNFIGREQLLIGLLGTDNGAAQLLRAGGATMEAAQIEVEKVIGRGSGFVAVEIPFTPRAKQAIEMAMDTAREQRFNSVKPEHLLLSIIDLGESVALKMLENLGVSIPQLREATLTQLQALPQYLASQPTSESKAETGLLSAIPPVCRKAPRLLSVTILPQETGRWVAEVYASRIQDGPTFSSLGYGDSDFEAIAEALEGLARMYRDYRA